MNENYKKLSSLQLQSVFIDNLGGCGLSSYEGQNPFDIRLDGIVYHIYIKNLSPAQLSNNNPDVWRIQLPIRAEFENIKQSKNLFVLLGYDAGRGVFTSWNPYWCKQRLNVGKSVSLYSRLSLQEKVSESGKIEIIDLNNDGSVVCIPQRLVGEYIRCIKKYYPDETEFIAKGSSIQKKLRSEMNDSCVETMLSLPIIDEFDLNEFGKLNCLNEPVRRDLYKYIEDEEYPDYDEMIKSVRQYYPDSILEKMSYADWVNLFKVENWTAGSKDDPKKGAPKFRTKTIRVTRQNGTVIQHRFVVDTYREMIEECSPAEVMKLNIQHAGVNIISTFPDEKYADYQRSLTCGLLLFVNSSTEQKFEDLCKINNAFGMGYKIELIDNLNEGGLKSGKSSQAAFSKIKVIFPDGRIIVHEKVLQTLVDVVEYADPELVERLNLIVCNKNLVLNEPHESYANACKPVKGGKFVNTYSNTDTKYRQICIISQMLKLGLVVELV